MDISERRNIEDFFFLNTIIRKSAPEMSPKFDQQSKPVPALNYHTTATNQQEGRLKFPSRHVNPTKHSFSTAAQATLQGSKSSVLMKPRLATVVSP